MYLIFLKTKSSLQLYDDIGPLGNKETLQFCIYEQNLVVDILTLTPPSISLIQTR